MTVLLLWGVVFSFLMWRDYPLAKNGLEFLYLYLPAGILSSFEVFAILHFVTSRLSYKFGVHFSFRTFFVSIIISIFTSIFGFIIFVPYYLSIDSGILEIRARIFTAILFVTMITGALFLLLSNYLSDDFAVILFTIGSINMITVFIQSIPIPPMIGATLMRNNTIYFALILILEITIILVFGRGIF